MLDFNSLKSLPTAEDLPETDNLPVDNELQILLPTLLRGILAMAWAERTDWLFAVNLGLYYDPEQPAIGPDAFLSLGVERFKPSGKLRLSYVVWEEQGIIPQWVLEIVSQAPGGEYDQKMQKYAAMGVLYYTIYNPDYYRRSKHDPFEVYRLEQGVYVRQQGQMIWMPELGLGIGCDRGRYEGHQREWLYWYNEQGQRYPTPDTMIQQERQRAEQERQRAEQERSRREELLRKLQERGIDLDNL